MIEHRSNERLPFSHRCKKQKKCSFYHSRMVAITKHIFRHVYPYTHTHTLGCTHVYIRLFKPIQQPWWYKNKCKRILFFIMLAQNTTWISLLLFLETTSPYEHDGSLRFCVLFQFETHGRYHSSSMLTVFLKLLFRQYILWCDGYQVSYLRMFVLCVIARVIFVGDFVCILIVGAFFLVTVYTSKSLLWFILEKL